MTEETLLKKKRRISFPSAWLIVFILLVIAAIMTYVVPAGSYSTLIYNEETAAFTITSPNGDESEAPATQDTLDQYGIQTELSKLVDGTIWKPIAIPDTYERVASQHQGLVAVIMSTVNGVYETVDIMFFVLVLGGCLGILTYSGAFTAGIGALSRVTKGREYLLIIAMTFLIAMGGTTFGMAEETMALYPVLVPVFLAARYDALVCVTSIYMGSTIGCMFSTVNPFSVVIASNAAGIDFTSGIVWRLVGLVIGIIIVMAYIIRYARIVKADPTKSLIYSERNIIEAAFEKKHEVEPLNPRYTLALIVFLACFIVMIYGVIKLEWWFGEMTAVFMVGAFVLGAILKMPEKIFFNEFINGASALVGVGIIIGFSRSVNIMLENGKIQDTILQSLISGIGDMSPYIFLIVLLFIFLILGFFINSSSALAVLTIPIMAPLADAVGLPRELVVSAYIYGLGIITAVSPCSLALITCEMVKVPYVKYVRFLLPLVGILTVLGIVMLLLQAMFG